MKNKIELVGFIIGVIGVALISYKLPVEVNVGILLFCFGMVLQGKGMK